jgi:DNA mismatch repair ATPase MutS
MIEMAQGLSQSTDTSNSIPTSSEPAPAPSSEERTFKQSEVTDIVKRERNEAIDRYRRLQNEQPQYVAQKYGDVERSQDRAQPQPVQSGQNLNEGQYRKIAAEEAQRLRDQWMQDAQTKHQEELAQKTVQNFWSKVQQGRDKYEDFEKVTGNIEFAAFPNVVQLLANHVDNASDVMYELGRDLGKMEVLESMAMRSPKAAIMQAQRMAESLKANEDASKVRTAREPLNQLRPTNTGMDNGEMSVRDYRKKYKV